jgi:hypothetical protein
MIAIQHRPGFPGVPILPEVAFDAQVFEYMKRLCKTEIGRKALMAALWNAIYEARVEAPDC